MIQTFLGFFDAVGFFKWCPKCFSAWGIVYGLLMKLFLCRWDWWPISHPFSSKAWLTETKNPTRSISGWDFCRVDIVDWGWNVCDLHANFGDQKPMKINNLISEQYRFSTPLRLLLGLKRSSLFVPGRCWLAERLQTANSYSSFMNVSEEIPYRIL